MPAWRLHLKIASEVSKHIKLDKNEFLIGNLLPNYCCGEIIKNIPNIIDHDKAHFLKKENIDLRQFYYIYQYQLRRKPIILGYYVHLIVDDFFNKKFNEKIIHGRSQVAGFRVDYNLTNNTYICTLRKAKKIRKWDFKYYDEKLKYEFDELYFKETFNPQLKLLEGLNVSLTDVKNLVDYVNLNPKLKNYRYKYIMFLEKEIDELTAECIDYVVKFLTFEVKVLL